MPKKHANIIILVVSDLFAPGALVNIVKEKIYHVATRSKSQGRFKNTF